MVESLLFIEAGAGASKKRTGSATLQMVGPPHRGGASVQRGEVGGLGTLPVLYF